MKRLGLLTSAALTAGKSLSLLPPVRMPRAVLTSSAMAFARSLPKNTHMRKTPKTQADFDAMQLAEAKRERKAAKLRMNGL